jgi:plasmid stabilization system protein ParE
MGQDVEGVNAPRAPGYSLDKARVCHFSRSYAAEKLGLELLDMAMSLDSMPYRGSKVKRRRGVLKLVHGNYLLYYRVVERKRAVQIISVQHGATIK